MQYTEIFFSAVKIENLIRKLLLLFFFAQNIDCGYKLEPPRRGDSKEYQQSMFCMSQFYYIKVGFKRVFVARTCFPDICDFVFINIFKCCVSRANVPLLECFNC